MKQHLVYLLTNTSKTEGRRFYIGSKQEASIEMYDGVMTVLNRVDEPYYSSTTSYEMLEAVRNGDVFEASLLEYVGNREDLISTENKYIVQYSAVESGEYYNKAYAILNAHYDENAIANKYGENISQLSSRNSAWSKRDGRARECGFDNFGEMYLWIQEQKDIGRNGKEVSEEIGKERHFAFRTIKDMDLHKASDQYLQYKDGELQKELRVMIYNKCSPYLACKLLGLELAAGRLLLGDFKHRDAGFVAALKNNLTKGELEKKVVQYVYDSPKVGNGFKTAATKLNLSLETTRRYFIRYVKANMPRPE